MVILRLLSQTPTPVKPGPLAPEGLHFRLRNYEFRTLAFISEPLN